jgi:hypothetical protein
VVTVVARIWLPDRPGALGQVASRVGAVRGDVLAIEILERGAGQVIDELTISLPDDGLITLLAAEVDAVDGASVESVRTVDDARADPSLLALTVAAEIAEAPAGERPALLCRGVHGLVEADWTAVMGGGTIVESVGVPPDPAWLAAFGAGSGHLDADTGPTDLVSGRLEGSGLSVAAGRAERPIHERERRRTGLLLRLADSLIG